MMQQTRNGLSLRTLQGDALLLLREIEKNSVDLLIADPPYCSGGTTTARRTLGDPNKKYCKGEQGKRYYTMLGDQMDGVCWQNWCAEWLSKAQHVLKQGAYYVVFCDWRQLPHLQMAVQWGTGASPRGIIPWNKGRGARLPHSGYCRHQCEYIIWGTKGSIPPRQELYALKDGTVFRDGLITENVNVKTKIHVAEKPIELFRKLMSLCPKGGQVLDLFMGSGACGEAAWLEGRNYLGIELSEDIHKQAERRLLALLE